MRISLSLAVLVLAVGCGNSSSSGGGGGSATGGGTSTGGGSATGGGGGGDADAGQPISADAGVWTFVQFPDSHCANGSPAAIGVNLVPNATQLAVYFEGGGACWSEFTCYQVMTAVNISNDYTEAVFDQDLGTISGAGFFDRDAGTPFAAADWVFVPYCTGDVFSGTADQNYSGTDGGVITHHEGGLNVDAFLRRLVPTLPNPTQVWLSGSSAGAFGAELNIERFSVAYPNAHIDVLSDSGPFISDPLWPTLQAAWAPVIPPCPGCTNFPDYLTALQMRHPNTRWGLLSYDKDGTISQFFSLSGTQFQTELNMLITSNYNTANAKSYVLPGTSHVLLDGYTTTVGTLPDGGTGESLKSFVDDWATGSSNWQSFP